MIFHRDDITRQDFAVQGQRNAETGPVEFRFGKRGYDKSF